MTKFEMSGERNLTMLTDLYQLTMANGYFECGMNMRRAAFDLFYRGGGGGSRAGGRVYKQAAFFG